MNDCEYIALAPRDLKPGMRAEHWEVVRCGACVLHGVDGHQALIQWRAVPDVRSEMFWPDAVSDLPVLRVEISGDGWIMRVRDWLNSTDARNLTPAGQAKVEERFISIVLRESDGDEDTYRGLRHGLVTCERFHEIGSVLDEYGLLDE